MTRDEWERCGDPGAMLSCLHGPASKRKRLLVYSAFFREFWGVLEEFDREAVEAAEGYAGGDPGKLPARLRGSWPEAGCHKYFEKLIAITGLGDPHALRVCRCVLGNPFRPAALDQPVLAANDGLVVRLARAAYEERKLPEGRLDTARLAVLADALEEAGVTDAEILGHLRTDGPHWQGCWPLDLVLERE